MWRSVTGRSRGAARPGIQQGEKKKEPEREEIQRRKNVTLNGESPVNCQFNFKLSDRHRRTYKSNQDKSSAKEKERQKKKGNKT